MTGFEPAPDALGVLVARPHPAPELPLLHTAHSPARLAVPPQIDLDRDLLGRFLDQPLYLLAPVREDVGGAVELPLQPPPL